MLKGDRIIQAPRAHELLVFSHDPDFAEMSSRIYQSEWRLGGNTFLVRDMFGDRYIVSLGRVTGGRRVWKTVSERGAYPSGNTRQARSKAIEQTKASKHQ